MPHGAMVEGEQISKEEAESNGWITAYRKRNADKTRFKHETHSARQTGAYVGPAKDSELRKVAAASRLPRLPTSHFRVVVRPGGGLDARTCNTSCGCSKERRHGTLSEFPVWLQLATYLGAQGSRNRIISIERPRVTMNTVQAIERQNQKVFLLTFLGNHSGTTDD
ncbi:hypothetical protein MRX96_026687 [Rhipicephalus microplus]